MFSRGGGGGGGGASGSFIIVLQILIGPLSEPSETSLCEFSAGKWFFSLTSASAVGAADLICEAWSLYVAPG